MRSIKKCYENFGFSDYLPIFAPDMNSPFTKHGLALAGMMAAMWGCPAWAGDFVTSDQLRFCTDVDEAAAYLTYLALDTANATAYSGQLVVPAQVTLPEVGTLPVKGVTAVACVYCDDLTSVTLDEGIESIGYAAFSDCRSLTEVSLPSSLTTLSDLSFYRDTNLQRIDLPGSVGRVGNGAFSFCYALEQAELPQGLSSIASNAFYQCSSLSHISLPSSLRQLGQYAFAYCSSLSRIEVNASPLAITEDVFEGLDRSQCKLVVPHNLVEAYQQADVWKDFEIVDVETEGLDEVLADDPDLLRVYSLGDYLHVMVLGDAPALVYDLHGRRVALCASGSGDNALLLPSGQYIVKCGRVSQKVIL